MDFLLRRKKLKRVRTEEGTRTNSCPLATTTDLIVKIFSPKVSNPATATKVRFMHIPPNVFAAVNVNKKISVGISG